MISQYTSQVRELIGCVVDVFLNYCSWTTLIESVKDNIIYERQKNILTAWEWLNLFSHGETKENISNYFSIF